MMPMDSSTVAPHGFDPMTGKPLAVPVVNTGYAPPHQTFQMEMQREPRDIEDGEVDCCGQRLVGKTGKNPAEKGRALSKYSEEMAMLNASVDSVVETAGLSFDDAFGTSGWSGTPVDIKEVSCWAPARMRTTR